MDKRNLTIFWLARRLGYYLAAVAIAYGLASIFATQSVISSLADMGVAVPVADRINVTLRDLAGMASMFLPMVAFALLMAFMTAALLCRWLSRWRLLIYLVAGATALIGIHLMLQLAFGLSPVAAARTAGGLMLQGAAGAVGGLCYLALIRRQPALAD